MFFLFFGVIEVIEEVILNFLVVVEDIKGYFGYECKVLFMKEVVFIFWKYGLIKF